MLKKIIIKLLLLTASINLNAGNNFIKDSFNFKNMSLSDSYRYLIAKKDILLFIKNNSLNRSKKNNLNKYLTHDYSQLCHDLYFGNDFLIKNTRETKVSLKYAILQGYYTSAKHLSTFLLKEKKILDSIYWAGLAAGHGVDITNTTVYIDYISKTAEFNKIFKIALKDSINLNIQYLKKLSELSLDIHNMQYSVEKNKDLYLYLKDGDFSKLSKILSERTDSASELILLSHSNNKDWKSLIEYCDKYFNSKLNQYCLKSINKYSDSDFPQIKYSLNEFHLYEKNKMRKQRLKNAAQTLGYYFEEGNKYSEITFELIIIDLEDRGLIETIVSFNEGRKIYKTKRISKQ